MSHINQRKIAIVATVILGIVAAFYLGGVCDQLNADYQQGTADGGMIGDAAILVYQGYLRFRDNVLSPSCSVRPFCRRRALPLSVCKGVIIPAYSYHSGVGVNLR